MSVVPAPLPPLKQKGGTSPALERKRPLPPTPTEDNTSRNFTDDNPALKGTKRKRKKKGDQARAEKKAAQDRHRTLTENKFVRKIITVSSALVKKLEILIVYLQLVALVTLLPVQFDDTKTFLGWTNVFLLDVRGSMFGDVEFRAHFLMMVCLAPLAVVLLMLIFLLPVYTVVWYMVLLGSLACFITGFTVSLLPSNEFTRTFESTTLYIAGLIGLVFVITSYVAWFLAHRKYNRPSHGTRKERHYRMWKDREKYLRLPRPWWGLALEFVLLLIVVFLAYIALSGGFTQSTIADLQGPLRFLSHAIGRALIILAVIILFHFILVQFQGGREFLANIIIALHHRFVGVVLFLLVISYVPVTNQVASVFSCRRESCPEGQVFKNSELTLTTVSINGFTNTHATRDACEPCRFTSECPEDFFFCDAETDWRLNVDPSLSCRSDIWPSYVLAGLLMGAMFVVGTAVSRVILIRKGGKMLDDMKVQDGHLYRPAVRRAIRTEVSHSPAISLFRPYLLKNQFARVTADIYLAVMIIVSVMAINAPEIDAVIIFALAVIAFLTLLFTRPYVEQTENFLAIFCALGVAINASAGVAIAAGQADRTYSAAMLLLATAACPCLGFIIGWIANRKVHKQVKLIMEKGAAAASPNPSLRVVVFLARMVRIPQMLRSYRKVKQRDQEEIQSHARKLAKLKSIELTSSGMLPEPDPEDVANLSSASLPEAMTQAQVRRRAKEREQIALAKQAEKVDASLDHYVETYLTRFFLVLGVVTFLAMTIVLVDIVYNSLTTTTVPHRPTIPDDDDPDFIAQHEFAGNFDWETFAAECCCGPETSTAEFPLMERWTCLNGFTKQKARKQIVDGVEYSGLVLRPFCSRTFNPGVCEPFWEDTYDEEKWRFNYWKVEICKPSAFNGTLPVDERLLRRLW